MTLYFAYGSNMDDAALKARCPKARRIGRARLPRHRFVLMADGYASVRRDPLSDVHGVLFDLALSDIAPLDRYEDVEGGLYIKAFQPVVRHDGHASRALIYIGTDQSRGGVPVPGYMRAIVDAARAADLPAAYVAMLDTIARSASSADRRHIA
jgi:gamma-glutamylcyclotransferase (GGCT)/AIG2-like uncharacterized protein YtfP